MSALLTIAVLIAAIWKFAKWIRSEHVTSESNKSYRTENKSPFSQRWFDSRAIKTRNGKATVIEMQGTEVDKFLLWASGGEPLGLLSRGQAKTWEGGQTAHLPDGTPHGEVYIWAQIYCRPNGTHSRVAVAAMSDPGDKESAKAAVREWRRSH
jgi:hypothetical protein